MSSDLKVTNIKHESSSSNNLVLGSDGTTTVSGALTASSGIANAGTISAGTIGTGVTINAGTNVSGINQLVGISWNASSTTGETTITVENSKSYISIFFAWEGNNFYLTPPELDRITVDGSGNLSIANIRGWGSTMSLSTGTNTLTANVDTPYKYATLLLFEEGQTIDTA